MLFTIKSGVFACIDAALLYTSTSVFPRNADGDRFSLIIKQILIGTSQVVYKQENRKPSKLSTIYSVRLKQLKRWLKIITELLI